jgi:radical SAM-linked protein
MPQVFKPGRYLGTELGAFRKPWEGVQARLALCFPDIYEIGASSYAIKLLYSVVNNDARFLCDRVYAPAQDLRDLLRQHNLPLFGVETQRAIAEFDVMAVSLQYELNYTTALGLIDAAQLPLRSADRDAHPHADSFPLVLGGGPGASNPNPLLPFFDGFMVGDGEELLLEVLALCAQARQEGWSRHQKLTALAQLNGVLVPRYNTYVEKRVIELSEQNVQLAPLIPTVEAVHDRVTVEARRGCDRMCRFCQPAFINLPARERTIEQITDLTLKQLEETGYEECSLLSLSIADYSQFAPLVKGVAGALKEKNASLSLSSQRADRFSLDVAEAVQSVRKSTLTFAPEAGTMRLRDVINKNLSDADIHKAVTTAYQAGWNKVKLYYMIGLPTETQHDLDGIVATVRSLKQACEAISREQDKSQLKHLEMNITLSNFVPKPHTPFQWHPQDSMEKLEEKRSYLRQQLKGIKGVKANFTDPRISKLEAVISKAGPDLADALELAYHKGAYLDAWDDTLPFEKWFIALEECGIDVEAYTSARLIHPDDPLPWDGINVGLDKAWLRNEWERSLREASTTPCFEECSLCGVCSTFNIWPTFTTLSDTFSASPLSDAEAMVDDAPVDEEPSDTQEGAAALPEEEAGVKKKKKVHVVANPSAAPVQRLRFTAQKLDTYRYISHLDWVRLMQRAFKRAGIPIAYTQGFNPKPKMHFSPALPMFMAAAAEFLDVDVTAELTPAEVLAKVNAYLPPACALTAGEAIAITSPSIDASLTSMTYTAIALPALTGACQTEGSKGTIAERAQLLATATQPILVELTTPKGDVKQVDLVAALQTIEVLSPDDTVRFTLKRNAASLGGGWLKPQWLLTYLSPTAQWLCQRTALALSPECL